MLAVGCVVALLIGLVWHNESAPQRRPVPSQTKEASSHAPLALTADPTVPPTTPAWSPPGPDLVGRVTTTNGEPVVGAMVLIDAAGPRVGRGYT